MSERRRYRHLETPLGTLLLAGDDHALRRISFADRTEPSTPAPQWVRDDTGFADPVRQLIAYFNRTLDRFTLRLAPEGTPFQLRVWQALQDIPYGETISYGDLASRIGQPSACRAVGAANGRNPLPIVIPCHRVVGANGRLVGYGGGLGIKERLLALERGRLPFA